MEMTPVNVDSAPILRGDFDKRTVDTLAWMRTPSQGRMGMEIKENPAGGAPSITMHMLMNPFSMADEWSVLLDVVPSPGFSDESVRVYLATGLHDVGRPDLGADDEEADLETHWVALADALAMVFDGAIVNASTVAAVLAVHAVRTGAARPRPVDAPWPDRPARFAARKS